MIDYFFQLHRLQASNSSALLWKSETLQMPPIIVHI